MAAAQSGQRENSGSAPKQRSRALTAGAGAGAALGAAVVLAPAAEAATFTVSNLNNAGAGSLRQAVADANAATGDDTVVFQAGLTGTIQLAGGTDIEIVADGLSIQGPGASQITVDGGGADRIFTLYDFNSPDEAVTISGLTLTNGDGGGGNGGAVYSDSGAAGDAAELTISDSVLTGNRANGGGAIWADYGSLTITGSTLSDNRATVTDGGAVLSDDTDGDQATEMVIRNSTITGNTAVRDGGGLRLYGTASGVLIENSTISGNAADADAGAGQIYRSAGDVVVRNSTFSQNTAARDGGGLTFYDNQAVTVEGSTIADNQATDRGAGLALFSSNGATLVQNTTVSGNRADNDGTGTGGGGVYSFNGFNTARAIRNSTITGNLALEGGGVFATLVDTPAGGDDVLTLSSTIIADNTATTTDPDLGTVEPSFPNTRFEVGHSLIENLGQTQITETPAGSNLLGVDPVLSPLADNGGPTQTQLPGVTSPVLDSGIANGLATDQRGGARTFDASNIANRPGSDATDIGATELAAQGECKGRAATVLFVAGQPITGADQDDVILGTAAKDQISSGAGKDTVCGAEGNDKLTGQGGKDTLLGQAGKDRLTGSAGKDKIKGAAGKDRLSGGAGKDRLSGGAGKDVLKGGPGKDKLNGGPGKDVEQQ